MRLSLAGRWSAGAEHGRTNGRQRAERVPSKQRTSPRKLLRSIAREAFSESRADAGRGGSTRERRSRRGRPGKSIFPTGPGRDVIHEPRGLVQSLFLGHPLAVRHWVGIRVLFDVSMCLGSRSAFFSRSLFFPITGLPGLGKIGCSAGSSARNDGLKSLIEGPSGDHVLNSP